MLSRRFIALFLLLGVLLTSCASKADFDIRGEWEYTMTDSNGNTYDAGTVTFSGKPAKGTYQQINIDQLEYEGGFNVNGSTLELTGYETWKGTVVDANIMQGSWTHADGTTGIFAALRK